VLQTQPSAVMVQIVGNTAIRRPIIETDRAFYKSVLVLYIPLVLQTVLTYSVSIVDSIMLGSLSEVSMSAANIADQPFNIVSGVIRGLSLGSGIMIAQYWGKRDLESIRRTLSVGIKLGLLLSAVFTLIGAAFPAQIMSFYTNEEAMIAEGTGYLRTISFTFIIFSVSYSYELAIRSMENARDPLLIMLISYAINIFLNWCFIFGKMGFPAMGIMGAALGTLIARIVELVLCLVHMFALNKKLGFTMSEFKGSYPDIRKKIFKYGLPNMISETVFTLGISMYTMIFGHLGQAATSANTIVTMATRLHEALLSGVAGASSVLIGKTIGSGEKDKIMPRGNAFIVMAFVVTIISTILTLSLRGFILSLYNTSPETYELAKQMINVSIGLFLGYTYECLFVTGILVGGGDTKFIFWYTTIVMWGFTIPFAMLAAFVFNWSPLTVFTILKMDYVIKGIVGFIRYFSKKWIKDVTV
jgi:putative MATE family efflux protein